MQLSANKARRFNFDHNELWRHSICTGLVAKTFAPSVREDPDSAFTCGLLHDIGELICDVYFSSQYAEVLAYCKREQCHLVDAENAVLGTDHCHIGARVAGKWKLPDNIIAVIQNHHRPSESTPLPIIDLVHFGDVMSRNMGNTYEWNGKTPCLDEDVMARLGIDPRDIDAKITDIKKEFELGEFMLG